jgi:hypothetical protein
LLYNQRVLSLQLNHRFIQQVWRQVEFSQNVLHLPAIKVILVALRKAFHLANQLC